MKIKFDSGDNLRLNKTIEISIVTIGVGAVFHEYNRYYPQVFFRWMSIWNVIICYIMVNVIFW